MANEEHLEILKQGVKAWNQWREQNPEIKPALSKADLSKADLSGAGLTWANLTEADLSRADLRAAELNWANLTGANLTGAVIDKRTKCKAAKGCQSGVNGIWCERTDSAALMTLNPPGNSMQGSNPNAVIESLKRARRLHGSSMLLAATVILIAILGLETIKFRPIDIGKTLTPGKFFLLAIPISIGLLSLVASFMSDALKGARYLRDRDSAMTVGNFPWVLSRYVGPGSGSLHGLQSLLTRVVMIFHPLVYLYYWGKWKGSGAVNKETSTVSGDSTSVNTEVQTASDTLTHMKQVVEESGTDYPPAIFIVLMALLILLCVWVFDISQRFQRPILFDAQTEKGRKDNLAKLTEAVGNQSTALKAQTKVVSELVGLLKKADSSLQEASPSRKQRIVRDKKREAKA